MRIIEGQRVPRFYGLAWRNYDSRTAIALPVPLNILSGWLRRAWISLQRNKTYQSAYDKGYQEGLQKGRDFGVYLAHNQVLANELRTIIENFLEAEHQIYSLDRDDVKIDGWIDRFLETEKKRLKMERPSHD